MQLFILLFVLCIASSISPLLSSCQKTIVLSAEILLPPHCFHLYGNCGSLLHIQMPDADIIAGLLLPPVPRIVWKISPIRFLCRFQKRCFVCVCEAQIQSENDKNVSLELFHSRKQHNFGTLLVYIYIPVCYSIPTMILINEK